jgi:anthranilate/para-aminobenzoate synthase component I
MNGASSVVVRSDLGDTAYFLGEPAEVIRGGAEEWSRLEAWLERHRRPACDSPHPPGLAFGRFTYEGDYEFHLHPTYRIGSTDELWMETGGRGGAVDWRESVPEDEYVRMVRRAQEEIRAGNIYQVNLARSYRCHDAQPDPDLLFRCLWRVTAAPMAALFRGTDEVLVSASPELFLQIQEGRILTRPIKGTRPRDADPLRDQQMAFELGTDPKEIAELVMITDLLRNDLGRVCAYGTVEVTDLVRREAFSHVHHAYSTIVGELRAGIGAVEAVRACYPGGSITGAPKGWAMKVIRELEPEPRGAYTGAMGYFGLDGSARLAVTIRTFVGRDDSWRFHVGSGITAGSDPAREFAETCHKAEALMQAFQAYQDVRSLPVESPL